MKCLYCGEENPLTENGAPDRCFACGLYVALKDQLKDWQITLDMVRKCLHKRRVMHKHEDCADELEAMMHEMELYLQNGERQWFKPEELGYEPREEDEEDYLT